MVAGQNLSPPELKKERLKTFVHWITFAVIALKGVAKIEESAGKAAFLFAAAGAVALGIVFHHTLQARFRGFDAFFYLVEAAVVFYVAYVHHQDGARALHLVFYAAAAMYVLAAVMTSRRAPAHAAG